MKFWQMKLRRSQLTGITIRSQFFFFPRLLSLSLRRDLSLPAKMVTMREHTRIFPSTSMRKSTRKKIRNKIARNSHLITFATFHIEKEIEFFFALQRNFVKKIIFFFFFSSCCLWWWLFQLLRLTAAYCCCVLLPGSVQTRNEYFGAYIFNFQRMPYLNMHHAKEPGAVLLLFVYIFVVYTFTCMCTPTIDRFVSPHTMYHDACVMCCVHTIPESVDHCLLCLLMWYAHTESVRRRRRRCRHLRLRLSRGSSSSSSILPTAYKC